MLPLVTNGVGFILVLSNKYRFIHMYAPQYIEELTCLDVVHASLSLIPGLQSSAYVGFPAALIGTLLYWKSHCTIDGTIGINWQS